jgi:uncharacterized phage protein (predicted DNA packaging)
MSTPEIVTLDEAKTYLRVDGDADDGLIVTLIAAATEAALSYADAYDPETEVPARLKLAVLGHIAAAYDEREKVDVPVTSQGLARSLRTLDC